MEVRRQYREIGIKTREEPITDKSEGVKEVPWIRTKKYA